MAASNDGKLSVFDVLKHIGDQDVGYYSKLTEREKKEFSPFMTMQWMACYEGASQNPLQMILLNEFVNKHIFDLHKHPELLYYLMTACSDGTYKRYKWKKPAARQSKFPKSMKVVQSAYGYSTKQALAGIVTLSNDDIYELAEQLGYQKESLTDLKKELKKR